MKKLFSASALALIAFTGAASAAGIENVEIWDAIARPGNVATSPTGEGQLIDSGGGNYLPSMLAIIDSRDADATFTSSGLDYGPLPGNNDLPDQTFNDFLGADAASLSSSDANFGDRSLLGTVIRVTGMISLGAGDNDFEIFSDDGYILTVGGSIIDSFANLRPPGTSGPVTFDAGDGGWFNFELTYFEAQTVQAQFKATLNGEVIDHLKPVPLPAGLPLLMVGGAAFGVLRQRQKKKAQT